MNFIIPQYLIAETVCDKELACIFGDAGKMCKVEENIGDILIMKCMDGGDCRHKIKINGYHKCECEVRQSIFKNYGH